MKRRIASNAVIAPQSAPWRAALVAAWLGAAGALVAFAPAAWLAHGVAAATQGHVLLAEPQGSIWRGSAQLFLTGGAGTQEAAGLPGRVEWSLLPAWRGANVRATLPCCAAQALAFEIRPNWSGALVLINSVKLQLPAQWLSGLGAPWNTLDAQGQLLLSSDALQVDWTPGRLRLVGTVVMDMLDMSSRLSTLAPLGDYRLSLQGGDVPTLRLQTIQGALQLTGSGQYVGSRLRFAGEASAAEGREAALANVLNIIGRRQGAKSLISLG